MIIVFIITVVAVIGLVALGAQFNIHGRDRAELSTARARLVALQGSGEYDSGALPGSLVGCFVTDLNAQMPVSVALSIAEKRDDAGRWNALANIIIALLLVAGLAGTLLAFGGALGERPDIQMIGGSIDVEAVKKYTNQVYSGLSGAFWPSLSGIVATMILYFLRGVFVHTRRDRLFADLERFGFELSRRLFPPELKENASMLIIASKMDAVCESLKTQTMHLILAGEQTEKASADLKETTAALQESINGLTIAGNVIVETFSAKGAANKGLAAVRELFAKYAKAVKDERNERRISDESWKNALEAMSTEQQSFASELKGVFQSVTQIQHAQAVANETVVSSIKTITDSLDKSVTAIKVEVLEAHKLALSEQAARMEAVQDSYAAKLNQTLTGFKSSADTFGANLNNLENKINMAFGASLKKFHEAVEVTMKRVNESVIQVPGRITEAQYALSETMARTQTEALSAHCEMLRRIEAVVAGCVEATNTGSTKKQPLVPSSDKMTLLIDSNQKLNDLIEKLVQALHDALPTNAHSNLVGRSPTLSLWRRFLTLFRSRQK